VRRIVAVDQGTTATKAYTVDEAGTFEAVCELAHEQILPRRGWVEHDPEALLANIRKAVAQAQAGADAGLAAVGLDNQGETVVAWDARDGRPVCNAIVWQDTRTRERVARLKATGAEVETLARAGLPLDAYFSAAKLRWILDNVAEAKVLARAGHLRLGTSDAFFLDRLTGTYATDVTTASRTSLMNLDTLAWDETLCDLFGVPGELLPEIRPTAGPFGEFALDGDFKGVRLPLTASVVDQQAALFGHGCHAPGRAKITFGTGAFALAVTGPAPLSNPGSGLLPTVAWQIAGHAAVYALDGGVYNAGAAIDWLRGLGLFDDFAELESFDGASALARGVVFVPALSGLGCPFWDRSAAGLWIGLGLDTKRTDLCRAVLEGIALRSAQVVTAMDRLAPVGETISIDGGVTRNGHFRQFLAEALGRAVTQPATPDVTSLGTAWLAMLGAGLVEDPAMLPGRGGEALRHTPSDPLPAALHTRFADAVARARGWWHDARE